MLPTHSHVMFGFGINLYRASLLINHGSEAFRKNRIPFVSTYVNKSSPITTFCTLPLCFP